MSAPLPLRITAAPRAKLAVATINVEVLQLWLRCPHCQAALSYLFDPRGQHEVSCELCSEQFDIPLCAGLVLS